MRHLLIIGRNLDQLLRLSIALRDCSYVTTVAVTDDIPARALWSAAREICQIVVCLDERDSAADALALAGISPQVLFLTPDSAPALNEQLQEAACLVLSARERASVIAATLIAYESAPVWNRRA